MKIEDLDLSKRQKMVGSEEIEYHFLIEMLELNSRSKKEEILEHVLNTGNISENVVLNYLANNQPSNKKFMEMENDLFSFLVNDEFPKPIKQQKKLKLEYQH